MVSCARSASERLSERRTTIVEYYDAEGQDEGDKQPQLQLPTHAPEYGLYAADQGDILARPSPATQLLLPSVGRLGRAVEGGQAAGYAAHVAGEEALVLGRKRRVVVSASTSHLGGFPGYRMAVAIRRTRATAVVDVEARARPPTARNRRWASRERHGSRRCACVQPINDGD